MCKNILKLNFEIHFLKRLTRDVIDDNDAMRAAVVGGGDCSLMVELIQKIKNNFFTT